MDIKAVVKPALVLFIISAAAAALLGYISEITAGPIALQEQRTRNEAMQAVMPSATAFEELTDAPMSGTISAVYISDNGGFVVLTNPSGFSGAVSTMTGLDENGVITGLRVTGHSETPGLGAKATDPDFYEQFTGLSGSVAVTKDGGEIIAITSSTITSRAVASGANEALEWFAANGGAY